MRWSWTFGRIAGIELRIHATFFLVLAWLALLHYGAGGATGALVGVVFTLALFGSVVLHELGHALTARRFGVVTRDITLLPIGGVARLESVPSRPAQELAVALAGPAVTAVVAAALYVALRLGGGTVAPTAGLAAPGAGVETFVAQLMWANVWLLGFNLLPAFPMDGGRVLRALLARRMSYERATELAARIGRAFALLFGFVGFLYNPFLVLIALFVWLGAAGEAAAVQMRSALAGMSMEQVIIRDVRTLAPGDTLDVALGRVLTGWQEDFPVVEDGRVIGMLTRAAMLRGLAALGRDAPVAEVMERTFRTADIGEPLEQAVARLVGSRTGTLPVLEGGELRGVLTMGNVGELVLIDGALRASVSHARGERRHPASSPHVRIGGTAGRAPLAATPGPREADARGESGGSAAAPS
jgi:Zn-dependent protease/CBS domain-containing protein